ncbi:hypothetical protein BAUCODRAFT_220328 [Baudoinia panamericana UAMH 10762]|uniref:Uncharacterized protein n=1 Tax=Baudoinia panamericana (strain UAMH 10762) TaxID=717646 RepID=M2MC61_BAUPA|nr:uncharacterized protein BAUCODRAFT_220328 [Baudoinia panamericana UAMH 10762]EMC94086.1 hypothetical protein BAUCODRAFT_220328 [Baudoinia panamericana UAMH 10762]
MPTLLSAVEARRLPLLFDCSLQRQSVNVGKCGISHDHLLTDGTCGQRIDNCSLWPAQMRGCVLLTLRFLLFQYVGYTFVYSAP